jgi:Flp pilus assembly protein TadG
MSGLGNALPQPPKAGKHVRAPSRTRRRSFAGFRRDEDGGLVLFALFIFILMILVGGMAVDLMRFETRRVHVQNTLDAAVLAAANLDQTLDPEEVVRDYFDKAGYDPNGVNVVVTEDRVNDGIDLVGRSITANTQLWSDTMFMRMLDVPTLRTPVGSAVTENIQNVEISLVLDISGSMRWGTTNGTTVNDNRITRLREAVRGFARAVLQVECETDAGGVETCVQPPTTASTTINIIPYAGHVNPGRDVFEMLGGSRWHNWSSCKEVTNADFDHADLPAPRGINCRIS